MDDGRVSYKEAVEAIRQFGCFMTEPEEDVVTLYADNQPFQVYNRAIPHRRDLYSEDYELQRNVLIQKSATLEDVLGYAMNGDITYSEAHDWCVMNDISTRQLDRWLYAALRKPEEPIPAKPKEPWPYRLVAFINRILEILINSILEDFI